MALPVLISALERGQGCGLCLGKAPVRFLHNLR